MGVGMLLVVLGTIVSSFFSSDSVFAPISSLNTQYPRLEMPFRPSNAFASTIDDLAGGMVNTYIYI
jgi:hypothetical protein